MPTTSQGLAIFADLLRMKQEQQRSVQQQAQQNFINQMRIAEFERESELLKQQQKKAQKKEALFGEIGRRVSKEGLAGKELGKETVSAMFQLGEPPPKAYLDMMEPGSDYSDVWTALLGPGHKAVSALKNIKPPAEILAKLALESGNKEDVKTIANNLRNVGIDEDVIPYATINILKGESPFANCASLLNNKLKLLRESKNEADKKLLADAENFFEFTIRYKDEIKDTFYAMGIEDIGNMTKNDIMGLYITSKELFDKQRKTILNQIPETEKEFIIGNIAKEKGITTEEAAKEYEKGQQPFLKRFLGLFKRKKKYTDKEEKVIKAVMDKKGVNRETAIKLIESAKE